MRLVFVVAVTFSGLIASGAIAGDLPTKSSLFAKNNLVAWCIVPFDASKRGPAARAAMLKRLGITKLAYDWRAEHVPTFEDEILSMKKEGIEYLAFWSPASLSPGYQSMMTLIKKYKLHPQIWMIAPSIHAATQEQRVARSAKAMLPFVNQAKQLGCRFALYNHGGWSGEPENLIAMVKWLREKANTANIGIVYNFHHGHEHMDQFPKAFLRMVPYLYCVNLNGMSAKGPMILPLGRGEHDQEILTMIRDSGYRGPIGILDHRSKLDAEKSLQENLTGLQHLLQKMDDREALKTFAPREP